MVLGNPPWERIKLQEQEFFAARSPAIAGARNKAERDRLIEALGRAEATPGERGLYREYLDAKHEAEAASLFVRRSGRFPLTGTGDVNTYAIFAETCRVLKNNEMKEFGEYRTQRLVLEAWDQLEAELSGIAIGRTG